MQKQDSLMRIAFNKCAWQTCRRMSHEQSEIEILAETASGVVTVSMQTDYGRVSFSYSPADVEAGIARLAREMLMHPDKARRRVDDLSLDPTQALKAANLYGQRATLALPNDDVERFSPGSQAYARGTVEQFAEILAPAVITMLDYLAATALVLGQSDVDRNSQDKIQMARDEITAYLKECFGRTILTFWRKPQGADRVDT
jgi:hypothetical protein